MSKRLPIHVAPAAPEQAPVWRSLDEKADPERRTRDAGEEGSVQLPESSVLGRRRFLAVSGATAAAVGLSGCLRRPAEHILPYSQAPEYIVPGVPLHYATAVSHHGEAIGLLVETHEGRPTKVEGNPEHPQSLGGTDAQLQADIIQLYDPERTSKLLHKTEGGREEASWSDFQAFWRAQAERLGAGGGLAILSERSDSPSFARARAALAARMPSARVFTWSPVSAANAEEGARLAFGEPVGMQIDYARARRVLSIDCDFLGNEPGAVRNQRRWAEQRRLRSPQPDMGRLYVVEGTLSVTGINADNRLRLAPSRIEAYLRALAAQLARTEGVTLSPAIAGALRAGEVEGVPAEWIEQVAADLAQHRGASVVCVGSSQPARVHALAHAINAALGNLGPVVQFFGAAPGPTEGTEPPPGIGELAAAIGEGQVDTLVILGGNPAFDAPADLDFAAALERVPTSIHLAFTDDETSSRCTWHLPRAHAFESWGDHRASDGTVSVQQPLIAPLRGGHSEQEVLAMIAGIRGWRGYQLVRGTMSESLGRPSDLERIWRQSLHRGVVVGAPRPAPRQVAPREAEIVAALSGQAPAGGEGWDIAFTPSYQVYDGRYANVPWLLELPDPITKVVWDNAAYLSPASAEELGVSNGDLLRVSREGVEASLSIPAFVLPGHADRVITLPLGFGRTRAGEWGTGAGFDVYPLRTSDSLGFASGASVTKAGGTYDLAQTQEHHSMEGRPLAIDATLAQYTETPDFAQWRIPTPNVGPLWTQVDYSAPLPPAQGGTSYSPYPTPRAPRPGAPPRYKWGMVIDLSTCTGCSACVIACQAENNIPSVGKTQVALGREMHWIRLDRYFVGDEAANPKVAVQPVACQHCEEAPCENVCPVNATAHSPEGLNDMAYNRCIGTRYCMNNCPYKVRRFNFLDWHGDLRESEQMQFNPNVTVRMRGVMEKCTFCVQRIQAARIRARNETRVVPATAADVEAGRAQRAGEPVVSERRIRAEEVTPACAQACPSEAIAFGDVNDRESVVHQLAHTDRQYKLLASIGTQPRTTFLGKIRNPNPEIV